MQPTEARARLLEQHARIREQVATCTRVAALVRSGRPVLDELDVALVRLRNALAAHNAEETAIVSALLGGVHGRGTRLVERMLEEHLAEHAVLWGLLCGASEELALRIDDLADELDAHMAAEERTFLSPVTLRDDANRPRSDG